MQNASVSVRMSLRCKQGLAVNPSSLTNLMSSCAFSPDDYEGRRCVPPPRYSGSHVTAVGFGGAGCARVGYLCGGLTGLADSSTSGVRLSHRGSARFVGGWELCCCRAVVASRAGRISILGGCAFSTKLNYCYGRSRQPTRAPPRNRSQARSPS